VGTGADIENDLGSAGLAVAGTLLTALVIVGGVGMKALGRAAVQRSHSRLVKR
jgi:hypothetical protein